MAVLPILIFPDERLRRKAEPVVEVDDEVRKLLDDMAETMYYFDGVGLAAPQVDRSVRAVVIDVSPVQRNETEGSVEGLLELVNPEIVEADGEIVWEEGCLSLPGVTEEVTRKNRIVVKALDRNGEPLTVRAEGFKAVALQHEIDHLDSVIFTDYLSPLKRRLVKKRLTKLRNEQGEMRVP